MIATALSQPLVLAPEDAARADLYATLAHLFVAAPGRELLAAIAASDDVSAHAAGDAPLAGAWRRLQQASSVTDAEAICTEYSGLFVGVGKAEVPLNASWYLTGAFNDAPLVALRTDLAQLGLSRLQSANETEDHIAALCESMRLLVAGDSEYSAASVAVQKEFFVRHLGSWYGKLVERIDTIESASFYRAVGALMKAFLDTESAQFENY